MKLVLSLGIGLLNLVALCGAAGAQTLRVPRVEVGGEAGMLVAIGEGLHPMPTAGPTVTLHISQQDAIELAADTIFLGSGQSTGCTFFNTGARRGVRPIGQGFAFYTAGTRLLHLSESSRASRDATGWLRRHVPRAFHRRSEPAQHRDIRRGLRAGSQPPCIIPARG